MISPRHLQRAHRQHLASQVSPPLCFKPLRAAVIRGPGGISLFSPIAIDLLLLLHLRGLWWFGLALNSLSSLMIDLPMKPSSGQSLGFPSALLSLSFQLGVIKAFALKCLLYSILSRTGKLYDVHNVEWGGPEHKVWSEVRYGNFWREAKPLVQVCHKLLRAGRCPMVSGL